MRLTAETSRGRGGLRHGVKARSERYVYVEEKELELKWFCYKEVEAPEYIIARSM